MIETQDLTRRYGQVTAVDRLSLKVAEGELVVLLGGSGSGKTTTLKMVNRLIEPTSGRVLIDGEDAAAHSSPTSCAAGSDTSSSVSACFPHMTVGENVGITLTLLGWDRATDIAARVDELLELVELDPAARARSAPRSSSRAESSNGSVSRVRWPHHRG